ncbi:hypothetical protein [Longirhabdus pacifica]|uniref:hypothetical protein n=1 Tax=Longirhabdus pacifica TaxID=2305227 RepID=UPI0010088EF5|nr:hypothetical protein [Longirhabdus pacifica]
MKKYVLSISFIFCAVLIFTVGAYAGANMEEIKAHLNKNINFKVMGEDWTPQDQSGTTMYPITYEGSTYLPVRAAGEALDCQQKTRQLF